MAFYHCLLVDLDGTLLDFDKAEDAAIRNTLKHFGFSADEDTVQQYRAINSALWIALERGEIKQEKLVVQRFQKLLSQQQKTGDAVQMNDYFLTQLSLGADLIDEAEETLRELAEVATIAIVSNGVERVQVGRLERSGLGRYVDEVFISSKVGASKPAQKIFDTAIRTLGIENRKKVLVIGDSLKADIAGGKSAGLVTCWCNFNGAALPEGAAKPDFTIQSLHELFKIVMEQEELDHVGMQERRHQI